MSRKTVRLDTSKRRAISLAVRLPPCNSKIMAVKRSMRFMLFAPVFALFFRPYRLGRFTLCYRCCAKARPGAEATPAYPVAANNEAAGLCQARECRVNAPWYRQSSRARLLARARDHDGYPPGKPGRAYQLYTGSSARSARMAGFLAWHRQRGQKDATAPGMPPEGALHVRAYSLIGRY